MTGHNCRDGAYPEGLHQMMAAYDKLPPELREAVANSIDQWAATPLLKLCRRCRDARKVVAWFKSSERSRLAFFEYHRARALGAYAGNWPETEDGGKEIPWRSWPRSEP
jgi:hypothetical protein